MRLTMILFSCAALLPAAGKVTFSEDIAAILYENCVTCHRPGEAAPFALISYDDVKKRGAIVAAVTQSRYMPPWHAEHGYGEFRDERRLTDEQIAKIGEWVKAGMPEGDRAKMPKLPEFTEGWRLGKPDLILAMSAGFDVPATGPDVYRNFIIPTKLTEDKWVRAVEFHPAARKAVHHAIFAYVRSGALASYDGKDGSAGFTGMTGLGLGIGLQPDFAPTGALGGWAVGGTPYFLPEGQAVPLAKGTDVVLQMHFHPTGKAETEKSVIGVYFADKAPEKKLLEIDLPALFGFGTGLDIGPGVNKYTIQDSVTLTADVQILSAAAHAHYLGREMKATATLPDGTQKPLLWINNWDFNWQEQYVYKAPVRLPKGTRIDVSINYDNSSDNPRNPSNPARRVYWGEQSADEMGGIGFQVVTDRKEDEGAIERMGADRLRSAFARALENGTINRFQQAQRGRTGPPPKPQQLTLLDREGKRIAAIGPPGVYTQPSLSPDGTKLAVIRTDPEADSSNVWVFDVATGQGTALTTDIAKKSSPMWSPDGKQIAYVAVPPSGNVYVLYRRPADGSKGEEMLYSHTPPGSQIILTDWSAGGVLCFWSAESMYSLALNGDRKPVQLFSGMASVRAGRFSPDGKMIGFSSNQSGRWETYVAPVNGGSKPVQVSKDGAMGGIFWRNDGKELSFMSLPGFNMMSVVLSGDAEVQGGTPKRLFRPAVVQSPGQLGNIATPDMQRFVFLSQAP